MRAPAFRKPAPHHIRPDDATNSIAQDSACPFACLRTLVALYAFGAHRPEDAVATYCQLCDQSFTRAWLHAALIDTGTEKCGEA